MAIQYPYAIDGNGLLRHIDEKAPSPYQCSACGEAMIGKRGPIKAHHFAHKATQCDPDTALHKITQGLIMRYYNEAKERGGNYIAHHLCPRCKRNTGERLVKPDRVIREEKRDLIKGTRPDLALLEADGRIASIIEIVVEHDLEEGTQSKYDELSLRVFKTRPSWETLAEYHKGFTADPDSLNLILCQECSKATEYKVQNVRWMLNKLEAVEATIGAPFPSDTRLPRNDYGKKAKEIVVALLNNGAHHRYGKSVLFLIPPNSAGWALNLLPLWEGNGSGDGNVSLWLSSAMKRALEGEAGTLALEEVKEQIEQKVSQFAGVEWWQGAN